MAGVAGQGRRFDADEALESATHLFWRHGYEGASIKLLTEAMGINPPSLYKAFGSKESLFFAAVDHYSATHGGFFDEAFRTTGTPVELLRSILHGAAEHYARAGYPGGCLTICAADALTPENRHIGARLAELRNSRVSRIAEALAAMERRRGAGELRASPDVVAAFVGATMQGMSQQARDGASGQCLHEIAELTLSCVQPLP